MSELELKQRIRHVAVVLHRHLPLDYPGALRILREAATDVESLGFTAMAFNDFVEEYGVGYPEIGLTPGSSSNTMALSSATLNVRVIVSPRTCSIATRAMSTVPRYAPVRRPPALKIRSRTVMPFTYG